LSALQRFFCFIEERLQTPSEDFQLARQPRPLAESHLRRYIGIELG
jgi:hypothetical protein